MRRQKKKSRHSKHPHNRQYKDRLWRMIFSMLRCIPGKVLRYLYFQSSLKTLKEDAREEGRAEGLMEGRAETRAELNEFKLLNKYLLKAKRYSDLESATEDIEYQKKLLKELGIE